MSEDTLNIVILLTVFSFHSAYTLGQIVGNASSDSDSKGSVEADRDHQKKKRNSFRRKKNRSDHQTQGADDSSPHHKPHLGERIYDMPGTFSPDEDEVGIPYRYLLLITLVYT